jgi:hypothetical protein
MTALFALSEKPPATHAPSHGLLEALNAGARASAQPAVEAQRCQVAASVVSSTARSCSAMRLPSEPYA